LNKINVIAILAFSKIGAKVHIFYCSAKEMGVKVHIFTQNVHKLIEMCMIWIDNFLKWEILKMRIDNYHNDNVNADDNGLAE